MPNNTYSVEIPGCLYKFMFKENEESIIKKPSKLKSPENLLSIVLFSNKRYPISTPISNSQNLNGNK